MVWEGALLGRIDGRKHGFTHFPEFPSDVDLDRVPSPARAPCLPMAGVPRPALGDLHTTMADPDGEVIEETCTTKRSWSTGEYQRCSAVGAACLYGLKLARTMSPRSGLTARDAAARTAPQYRSSGGIAPVSA